MENEDQGQSRKLVSNTSKGLPTIKKVDREKLSRALELVWAVQQTYGKSLDNFGTQVDAFVYFLNGYSVEQIVKAIGIFVRKSERLPTPSDCLKILEPTPEDWKPDWVFYTALKKRLEDRGTYDLSQDEHDYIAACEAYSLNSLKRFKEVVRLSDEQKPNQP